MSRALELKQAVGGLIRHVNNIEPIGVANADTQSRIQAVMRMIQQPATGPVSSDTISVLMGTVVLFRPELSDTDVVRKTIELLPVVLPRYGTRVAQSAKPRVGA